MKEKKQATVWKLILIILVSIIVVSLAFLAIKATLEDTVTKANNKAMRENAICPSGNIDYGHSINYCDGHPFRCTETKCTFITVAEETYNCGKGCIRSEEIPLR